jgi:hypothetical protein
MRHLTIAQAIKLANDSKAVVDIRHQNPELALREIMEYWPNVNWVENPDGIVSVIGYSDEKIGRKMFRGMFVQVKSQS